MLNCFRSFNFSYLANYGEQIYPLPQTCPRFSPAAHSAWRTVRPHPRKLTEIATSCSFSPVRRLGALENITIFLLWVWLSIKFVVSAFKSEFVILKKIARQFSLLTLYKLLFLWKCSVGFRKCLLNVVNVDHEEDRAQYWSLLQFWSIFDRLNGWNLEFCRGFYFYALASTDLEEFKAFKSYYFYPNLKCPLKGVYALNSRRSCWHQLKSNHHLPSVHRINTVK